MSPGQRNNRPGPYKARLFAVHRPTLWPAALGLLERWKMQIRVFPVLRRVHCVKVLLQCFLIKSRMKGGATEKGDGRTWKAKVI